MTTDGVQTFFLTENVTFCAPLFKENIELVTIVLNDKCNANFRTSKPNRDFPDGIVHLQRERGQVVIWFGFALTRNHHEKEKETETERQEQEREERSGNGTLRK